MHEYKAVSITGSKVCSKVKVGFLQRKVEFKFLHELATSLGLSRSPSHMLDCSAAGALDVDPHTEDHSYCRSIRNYI